MRQHQVVLVEPFYGGSHKQLIDWMMKDVLESENIDHEVYTLRDRKWHWKLMASSFSMAKRISRPSETHEHHVFFCSSMFNLAEFLALRPDWNATGILKVYYFHENQLTYPVQRSSSSHSIAANDFNIGWAQILSCQVADRIVFNSKFNRDSFFGAIDSFLRRIPEKPMYQEILGLAEEWTSKTSILYFPIDMTLYKSLPPLENPSQDPVMIVWNHRWEYDKNPGEFFHALFRLLEVGVTNFKVVVLGEQFESSPEIFQQAKTRLASQIVQFGFAPSKEEYWIWLQRSHVAVSTSCHEFYGVSMLESVLAGCYPICPNRLVYPEFYEKDHLYNTPTQLFKKLKYLCTHPWHIAKWKQQGSNQFEKHQAQVLVEQYQELLQL